MADLRFVEYLVKTEIVGLGSKTLEQLHTRGANLHAQFTD